MSPRNEFADHECFLDGLSDLQIQDRLKAGGCTVNDVRRHRGLPPATVAQGSGGEPPVEEGPEALASLAELRKEPGFTTTQAHIAGSPAGQ